MAQVSSKTQVGPLLLYAYPHEVKYIKHKPNHCISVRIPMCQDGQIFYVPSSMMFEKYIVDADKVILFGSAGLLDHNVKKYDQFFYNSVYVWDSVKTKEGRLRYVERGQVCDMESGFVANVCSKHNVPFLNVRYVIDKCDKRVMPIGINWLWRIFQHRRMQKKFDRMLRGL